MWNKNGTSDAIVPVEEMDAVEALGLPPLPQNPGQNPS